jgi:hypothetical protein
LPLLSFYLFHRDQQQNGSFWQRNACPQDKPSIWFHHHGNIWNREKYEEIIHLISTEPKNEDKTNFY